MKPAHALRALAVALASATAAAAQAQPADSVETLAIRSMNICLSAAAGGNLHQLAGAQGYELYQHTYSRRIGDRWTFFQAFPETEHAGPDGYSCRMTVMRPTPLTGDPVSFTKRGSVFADHERVMERLSNGPLSFGNPYGVHYLRERHPTRPGHLRTQLQRVSGNTVEIIYLEEGLSTFEMFYARGPKLGALVSAGTIEALTEPTLNASIQEQITWEARNDYCAYQRGGCPSAYANAPTVRERSSSSSSTSGGVYLNGYAPGKRALSSLEQDYYANKGYVIKRGN